MDLSRGDIVGVNLNPKKGDEVGKIRPCVIFSDNESNQILDTIIVAPLSTQLIDDMLPFRLRLEKREGLEKDSDILLNHIRTISSMRVTSFIGRITNSEYDLIRANLCQIF